MHILPIAPLLLALTLVPEPGVSQAPQNKLCKDCTKFDKIGELKTFRSAINLGAKSYIFCPGSSVRFQLRIHHYCARNNLPTTQALMKCIDEDNCKDHLSSNSIQEYSKGATKNPSTTIQSTTTTPYVTNQKTTPHWVPNIINSTEATERETSTSSKNLVPHDPKNDSNAHQGDKLPKASDAVPEEDSDGKTKNMSILALIFIILVMVGVGTFIYCRKKKPPCLSKSVAYVTASSHDSLEMAKAP